MAKIVFHDGEQGTQEWHDARQGKFTGSNAYKLLGTFGASEYAKAIQSDFKGNFFTKRGHILEDEAIELYEAIFKAKVERPSFVTNSDYPTCLYSPDGIDGDILLEVKCFTEEKHKELYNATRPIGDIPMKILAQIHYGMLICDKKEARLIPYNPDLEAELAFMSIPIPFNRDIANNFKRILKGDTHAVTSK